MKTITEFAAITLRNAAKTRQELTSAGKTAEELPAAMGEALKLEGDKLGFLMNAIEVAGPKLDDLKRVIVFTLAEGEKAPGGAQAKGEHQFLAEFYPPMAGKGGPAKGKDAGGRGGRGDKRGGRGGKGRGDKKRRPTAAS